MNRSRHISEKALERLEKQHRQLDAEVAQYASRRSLTAQEQADFVRLKKRKLAAKDALMHFSN